MNQPTGRELYSNIQLLLPRIGCLAICRKCGSVVWWVKHKDGKIVAYNNAGAAHVCRRRE
jgi:hypothetical protein